MKKTKILSLIIAIIMAFGFSGCDVLENIDLDKIFDMSFFEDEQPSQSSSSVPEEEQEPVDPNWPVTAFGTEITAAPEKVAVASPALAEYINDMRLLNKVCAVSDYCGFGGASGIPSIGSVRLPDMSAIKSAAPEYILTFSKYEETALVELQQMNIKVIVINAPQSLDELRVLYREIALFFLGAIEGPAFGENYVSEYDRALAEIAYSGEQKTAAFIRALDYIMVTGDSMADEILSAAGFINAAGEQTGYTYPSENWKEFDPAVLFVNSDIHLIDLETNDLYKKKSAVKGDKVYNADLDTIALCSRRSFEIIKDMLATVYEDYPLGTPLEPAYPSMYKQ